MISDHNLHRSLNKSLGVFKTDFSSKSEISPGYCKLDLGILKSDLRDKHKQRFLIRVLFNPFPPE